MSFLRAENCICGTSTTGAGTLTLAACPAPPGGVDPYAAFSGMGLGTSLSIPMTYCITEYTDTSFTVVRQQEKGIGALSLGANIGATTLARITPQSTATGCNTTTPTYSYGSPSPISIGTAANVLVFVGASAADIPVCHPYYETGIGDNLGAHPWRAGNGGGAGATLTSGLDYYQPFEWRVPMVVRRASMRCSTGYSGGTPVSNAYARLYAFGSNGRPGRLLVDFGLLGTANASLNTSAAVISSALATPGFLLLPGEYVFNFCPIFSGGTTGPTMNSITGAFQMGSRFGTINLVAVQATTATGGVAVAPDPANTTGYAGSTAGNMVPIFTLGPN